MRHHTECIPCCLRRVLFGAHLQSDDEWLHRKILAEAMQELARTEDDVSPAELMFRVARRAAKSLGVPEPYAPDKKRWLEAGLGQMDALREAIQASQDPFAHALRLSIAANLLDCEFRDEISSDFTLAKLRSDADALVLKAEAIEELRETVAEAPNVLFVHETAGELPLDRLLIETFDKKPDAVLSVVRDGPTLGAATAEDAAIVGLSEVARVIDPGIGCRGLPLSSCSRGFRQEFARAGVIVAKGQAAFETLEGAGGEVDGERPPTFFLLRVKCGVVARALGVEIGAGWVEVP